MGNNDNMQQYKDMQPQLEHWMYNGELHAYVHPLERSINYGDGVFTTLLWRQSKFEFIAQHIERLKRDSDILKINFESQRCITQLQQFSDYLQAQGLNTGIIKIIVSRGLSQRGYHFERSSQARLLILYQHLATNINHIIERGVELGVSRVALCDSILAGAKHLNRLEQVMASADLQQQKWHDLLMLSHDKHIIETTKANIFWFKNDKLYTPKLDRVGVCGVIRDRLILLAQQAKINLIVDNFEMTQLLNADEVFISNSVLKICPVVSLDTSEHAASLQAKAKSKTDSNTQLFTWPVGARTLQLSEILASDIKTCINGIGAV